jgi:hypothetical protein
MKKVLNFLQFLIILIVVSTLIVLLLDKSTPILVEIKKFGYLNLVIMLMAVTFILHFLLAYKYDKIVFERYYSKGKVVYGLLSISIVFFIMFIV